VFIIDDRLGTADLTLTEILLTTACIPTNAKHAPRATVFKQGPIPPQEPRWHQGHQVRWQLNVWEKNWLLDSGSLTQRLTQASGGEFRVEILRQAILPTYSSEAIVLGIPHRQQALVREVILLGRNTPWVFARSVIPLSTLTGRLRSLSKLDNRPLGALLFQDPNLQRSAMEVARINLQHRYLPPRLKATHPDCWGRRSRFLLDNKPLLVSEVFLDPSELA